MGLYSMTLEEIILSKHPELYGYNYNDIIKKGNDAIFGGWTYDIFSENYREVLNCKITKNFYLREIAQDSPSMFILELDNKMNLIMPYYNQLYASELIKIRPLINHDYSENVVNNRDKAEDKTANEDKKQNQTASANSTTQSHSFTKNADTPMDVVDTINNHLSSASESDQEYNSNSAAQLNDNVTKNETEKKTETEAENINRIFSGNLGMTESSMLLEFRKTFLRVDSELIAELDELFYGLWL